MKLVRWDTKEIIFEVECTSLIELLKGALKAKISLFRADLRGADLRGANLHDADLCGANLCSANLCGTSGNLRELRNMQIDTYKIGFTKDTLQIGCKRYSIKEWKEFKDSQIKDMDSGALEWWNKWKEFIFKAIELSYGETK